MEMMVQSGTKAPADAVASFVPQHNSLAGQYSGFASQHIRLAHPSGLVSQPPLLQAKLAIGQADDQYEREADRVAETVMRMPEPAVQRKPG